MEDAIDWRQLREFADVDLTGSFILSWYLESETLFVDIDVLLEQNHPFYETPRPAEKICIRPAIIEFPYCEGIGRKSGALSSPVEIVGTLQHGAIKGLRCLADGCYEIVGEFGTVLINAERPLLRLKGP
ncbi:MAG: hypothetical protein K0U72_07980 [Gammaproteobacteria bacterium]|nr:hypothetical protein [Gammaproteobacteria bacterium]